MTPRLQLLVKKLESMAAKHWRTAIPFMAGVRQMPLGTFGLFNSIFAITPVTFLRFYIALVLGNAVASPIYINLGILLRQSADLFGDDDVTNTTGTNSTVDDSEIEKQTLFLQQLQFGISIAVTIIILGLSGLYGRKLMKDIDKWSQEEIVKQIDEIDNEPETGVL